MGLGRGQGEAESHERPTAESAIRTTEGFEAATGQGSGCRSECEFRRQEKRSQNETTIQKEELLFL